MSKSLSYVSYLSLFYSLILFLFSQTEKMNMRGSKHLEERSYSGMDTVFLVYLQCQDLLVSFLCMVACSHCGDFSKICKFANISKIVQITHTLLLYGRFIYSLLFIELLPNMTPAFHRKSHILTPSF